MSEWAIMPMASKPRASGDDPIPSKEETPSYE